MTIKIVVTTDSLKQELLEGSEHIHGLRSLDTGMPGANFFAHLHLTPHLIEVNSEAPDSDNLCEFVCLQGPLDKEFQRVLFEGLGDLYGE